MSDDLRGFATRGTTATDNQARRLQQPQQGRVTQPGHGQPVAGPQQGAFQGAQPVGQPVPPGALGARPTQTRLQPAPPRPVTQRTTARSRAPRRAHLLLSRLDPWSVMKFSFVVSLVLFVVLFVAVAVLYAVLAGMGVFDSIISTARDLSGGSGTWDISGWFSAKTILGWTAVLGAVNVVLVTALATLGAFIYNLVTSLVGGVEVTLSEAE